MFSSTIILAYLALFLLGAVDNIRGPLYPYILENFGILESKGQWIFTLSSLFGLLTSLSAPKWLKFLPPVNTLKISILIHSLVLFLIGLAIEMQSFILLIVSSVFLGLAMGAQGLCVNTIIAQEVSAKNSRKIFSGLHSMYGIASLLSPLLLGYFFKEKFSIPSLFYGMSLLTIVIFFYLLKTPSLKSVKKLEGMDFKFLQKEVLVFGTLLCSYVSFEILVSSRLSLILSNYYGYTYSLASFFLSLFFVGLLAGRLFFSFVHLNIKNITLLKISAWLNLIVFIIGLYIYPPVLALTGLTCSFFFPTTMDLIKNRVKNNDIIITKIMILVSLSLSCMHPVFSILSDTWNSYHAAHLGFGLLFIVLYFLHFKVDEFK